MHKTSTVRIWLARAALVGYAAFIWYLSSYPSDAVLRFPFLNASMDATLKEALHLVEFGLFYVLFRLALPRTPSIWLIVLAFAAAVSDEVHQLFVPSRSFTLIDLGKDAFGILAAHFLFEKLRKRTPGRERNYR